MNGAKAPETPSPVLQEKTVTPATLPTVIGADEGYTGLSQVTVNPDTNLKAENIRSGKTIFGVDGSFVGEPVYTTTDLVKYCYENNKGIYGFGSISGMPVDFTVSYTGSGSGAHTYISRTSLIARCAAWQEANHYTLFNPTTGGSGDYRVVYTHKVTINSMTITKMNFSADTNNLTNSIPKGTPVSLSTTVVIYPYSAYTSTEGPAFGGDGVKTVTYNGTGTMKETVSPNPSGTFDMTIVLDNPITVENTELTYYSGSDNVDLIKSRMSLYFTFLSTYVEW